MTLSLNTLLSLLSLLATVTSHPGGYWWMGKEGAFGSQPNNKISPSPSLQTSGDAAAGSSGGYYGNDYGNNNQPTEDISASSSPVDYVENLAPSPSLPVPVVSQGKLIFVQHCNIDPIFSSPSDTGEDLPVTECPVGWKCVSELFCDASATMVSQRVQLSKAQIAIRGNLIVSFILSFSSL